jgi:hypothetical protein
MELDQDVLSAKIAAAEAAVSHRATASHKYLIFDRDQKFGFEVIAAVKATSMIPKQTSFRSPWQNGMAERWVGSCRRDLWTTLLR